MVVEEEKTRLRKMAIKNAISSWEDKKNGVYKWFEKERYSKEFCIEQINYFKKLK